MPSAFQVARGVNDGMALIFQVARGAKERMASSQFAFNKAKAELQQQYRH